MIRELREIFKMLKKNERMVNCMNLRIFWVVGVGICQGHPPRPTTGNVVM